MTAEDTGQVWWVVPLRPACSFAASMMKTAVRLLLPHNHGGWRQTWVITVLHASHYQSSWYELVAVIMSCICTVIPYCFPVKNALLSVARTININTDLKAPVNGDK